MPKTGDYKTDLLERLSDPEYAAGYLSACVQEGQEEFLLGLRNVAQAQGGLKQVSEATNLNRESLYSMLSEEGNPRLSSLFTVLNACGLQIQCAPIDGN